MHDSDKSDKYAERPWLFKPGQSGNPKGRPKGSKNLKSFAKEYLMSLSDKEKMEFMKGMDKKVIWEMAEDKPGQGVNLSGEVTQKLIAADE